MWVPPHLFYTFHYLDARSVVAVALFVLIVRAVTYGEKR
jgi:hypothetical protein